MKYTVLSIFPHLIEPWTREAIIGKAVARGLLEFDLRDIRDYATGRHRQVDDSPYGGGAGMVMRVDVLARALEGVDADETILLTPAGQPLTQELARELSQRRHLAIVCGRYEGFDARVETLATREVSLGDFVMMGGEAAAACLIEATARLIPGVIGDEESHRADSFASGILDYPEYTRPPTWTAADGRVLGVPAELLGGNHAAIARWRRREALRRTLERRPDLLPRAGLTPEDAALFADLGVPEERLRAWNLELPRPKRVRRRKERNDVTPLPDFVNEWADIEPAYRALEAAALDATTVPAWLARWSDVEKTLGETMAAASRAKDENTADEAAQNRYLQLVREVMPQARVAAQKLKAKLLAVPGFEPAPELAEFMRRLRNEADLFREENVPVHTELTALANEYAKVRGAQTVTLDGKELTLAQAGLKVLEPDRATRERAWRAISDRWLQDAATLDDLFLRLIAGRRTLARNAGLDDYRQYRWRELNRFYYTPEDCLRFHEAVEAEVVPVVSRQLERRRQSLGVETLRPWDYDWRGSVDPLSRPALKPFADTTELESKVASIFERLDPDLGEQFARLREGFLDLASRKNKAPGGYHSRFPRSGRSYIFMNAAGTHDNVTTLLHEGGHAFHFMTSSATQPLVWNQSGPIEFNEVASMAMELLAAPYLEREKGGFYTPEDAARARREHLEGTLRFLPYMAVMDAFQHWVYAEAPQEVTPADLDAKWSELWQRFMPDVDWSGLETARAKGWQRQLHIFQYPFYYVEYGLAQLGALQVWRNALRDPADALARYKSALALGFTRPLPNLYAAAGARLAFDRETVRELVRLVESHTADQ